MRLRIFMAGAMLASLGGCGGETRDGNAANDTKTTKKVAAVPTGGPIDCSSLPDFVPLYPGAKVGTCVSGGGADPDHESGTVIFTVDASVKDIIAWYKDKAKAAGLAQAISTDTMYAARDGSKRSIMTLAEEQRVGTMVTLNWGRDL